MGIENVYVTFRTVVNGAKNSSELWWAKKNAMKLYNRVCEAMNNGLIDKFNSTWNKNHPGGYTEDEYEEAYSALFSLVAKGIALRHFRKGNRIITMPEGSETVTFSTKPGADGTYRGIIDVSVEDVRKK